MIPFADLVTQHARLRAELEPVIAEVMFGCEFALGRHVEEFEQAFASYCGASFGVGVNSGTSALHLALLAADIGPGDEVITTAFTFVATVAAIAYTGAKPVLDPLLELSARHGLAVIEDAAQAHGAEYKGRRVGSIGDAGCFSFYPSKNLGAAGEAGMTVTHRPEWAERLRRLRNWGQAERYRHVEHGFNYRMAGIQGAVLDVKLRHLDAWNDCRRTNATRYDAAIIGPLLHPLVTRPWARHAYSIYAVRAGDRDLVQDEFRRLGVETRIHYPSPVHLLDAWTDLGYRAGDFPHAERAAREVVSLPVHPELSADQVAQVAAAISKISAAADHGARPTAASSTRFANNRP